MSFSNQKICPEMISHILHNEFLPKSLKLLASLRIICPGKNNNKINVLFQNLPQHACQYLLYIYNLTQWRIDEIITVD